MSRKNDEVNEIYYIPNNFTDSGRSLGGMIKTRNLIEAILVGLLMIYVNINVFTIEGKIKIVIFIFTVLPPVFGFAIGIHDDSITQYLINFFLYLLKRRKLHLKGANTNVNNARKEKQHTEKKELKNNKSRGKYKRPGK